MERDLEGENKYRPDRPEYLRPAYRHFESEMSQRASASASSLHKKEPREISLASIKEVQHNESYNNLDHHKICRLASERLLRKGYRFPMKGICDYMDKVKKRFKNNTTVVKRPDLIGNEGSKASNKIRFVYSEPTSQANFDHRYDTKYFSTWQGEPPDCFLALMEEFHSKAVVTQDKSLRGFLRRRLEQKGHSFARTQIIRMYLTLLREHKVFAGRVGPQRSSSLTSETESPKKGKNIIEIINTDGSRSNVVNSANVGSSAISGQLTEKKNSDILQELQEIKKLMVHYYSILKVQQGRFHRQDERDARKE